MKVSTYRAVVLTAALAAVVAVAFYEHPKPLPKPVQQCPRGWHPANDGTDDCVLVIHFGGAFSNW